MDSYTDEEKANLRTQLREGSKLAKAEVDKRGYGLHPRIAKLMELRAFSLTEVFVLWKAEDRAWRTVLGHGPQNAKLARFYEVRRFALGKLCSERLGLSEQFTQSRDK